jgi:hypothetical protein
MQRWGEHKGRQGSGNDLKYESRLKMEINDRFQRGINFY